MRLGQTEIGPDWWTKPLFGCHCHSCQAFPRLPRASPQPLQLRHFLLSIIIFTAALVVVAVVAASSGVQQPRSSACNSLATCHAWLTATWAAVTWGLGHAAALTSSTDAYQQHAQHNTTTLVYGKVLILGISLFYGTRFPVKPQRCCHSMTDE